MKTGKNNVDRKKYTFKKNGRMCIEGKRAQRSFLSIYYIIHKHRWEHSMQFKI